MKSRIILLLFALCSLGISGQTAKSVLDKTAALCTSGAVQIDFSAKAKQGSSAGTLVAQGNCFTLESPEVSIWFDGKTQWSLVKGSGEVNVVEPTAKEIAAMNPLNFIQLYKKGYKMSMKTVGNNHEIHMIATSKKQSISEMYLYIHKQTFKPSTVKLRTGKDWTAITVRNFKTLGKKPASAFSYNQKDHPGVTVIDMR
ncbi:MAG: LolA-like putative outer membrane lipoprotein chaperone [Alloprevotella sp.]